jgi:flagellar hook-associated protein 2
VSTATSTASLLNSVLQATNDSSSGGLDVTSAVAAVIAADSAPEIAWENQQTTISNQTAAINQLESESSNLSDQLNALNDVAGALGSISATTSDSTVVTASAQPGTVLGNHVIVVNQLATTASWYSSSVASSSTALPTGSFSISANGTTTAINIGGTGNPDTLDAVAASINSQSLGVTASVITDSSGARLALVAQSSGAAANFSVSVGSGSATSSGLTFTQPVTGADASLTVDGVPITSASNTVTGAISGVTLNLQGASSPDTQVNLSLAADSSSIESAIDSFVSAYNTLITDVNSQFNYNSSTNTDGTLSSDSVVRGLQSSLLAATNYAPTSGSSISSLAALGISTNQDGTLSVNSSTLESAINSNSSGVQAFFQGTAQNGFATSLNTTLSTYTDPTEGAFTVDLSSLSNEYQDLTDQINTFQLYITAEQAKLTTEYNNANIALQELPTEIKQTQTLLGENNSSSNN